MKMSVYISLMSKGEESTTKGQGRAVLCVLSLDLLNVMKLELSINGLCYEEDM